MKEIEQKCIELRYKGNTYREISKQIGGKVSEGVLRNWFATEGRLYIPYLEYCSRMEKFTEDEVRSQYREFSMTSYKIKKRLMDLCIKKGDYKTALEIVKDMDDRGGLVVIKKSEINVDDKRGPKLETYEQLVTELTRLGIDPRTGLRVAAPKVVES